MIFKPIKMRFITPLQQNQIFIEELSKADNDDADACDFVGTCYNFGMGIKSDNEQSKFWFETAAKLGNANAMDSLGNGLYLGRWGKKEVKLALHYLENAIKLGHSHAHMTLADCIIINQLDYKNYTPNELIMKAADLGDGLAQERLAAYYDSDEIHVDVNEKEQIVHFWLKKSAEQGLESAQSNLGFVYLNKNGLFNNYYNAYVWLNLAYINRPISGFSQKENLTKLITKTELLKAQKEVTKRYDELRVSLLWGYRN